MFVGREGPSVNVQIRVYLYGGYFESHGLQQCPYAASDDPLSDAANYSSADQDVLHGSSPPCAPSPAKGR